MFAIRREITPFAAMWMELVQAKSLRSCPNLCDPTDCCPPGSMKFSRQEYWSGLLRHPPGDLPNSEIEPMSLNSNLHWQACSSLLTPPR